jgi:hypothetical protein
MFMLAGGALAAPASSGAQPEERHVWQMFPDENGGAHLSYGVPETDNVAVGFTCSRHARRYQVGVYLDNVGSHTQGSRWPAVARLNSGAVRGVWRGTAHYDEVSPTIDFDVPAGHPVMRAFATTFRLGRPGEEWPARSRAERAAVTRFFAACR